jgi:glycosyltransferase involved in cell wall biosynthesis
LYEIIVVDDDSSDKTADVVLDFQKKNSILSIVRILDKKQAGKKAALIAGIQAARHEIILLSDADCYPASPNWIWHMQAAIQEPIQLGLGFSPYFFQNGFLNRFIRFEAIYTAVQYFSFALAGIPYMGVGRNLIYAKSLFLLKNDFSNHLDLASGDDDLFVSAVAEKYNTAVLMHPDSFVFSTPKRTWRGYYNQKSRHLSTSTRYKPLHQWLLGLLSLSHYLHYMAGIAVLCCGGSWMFVTSLYLARTLVVAVQSWFILRKFNDTSLFCWIPLLDLLLLLYYHVFAPIFIIGNPRTWKL